LVHTTASGNDVLSLAIDPKNPQTLYAGFYGQGVLVNGNAGSRASNTGLADSYVRSLLVFPSELNVVFAGTSKGLFISLDGGVKWTPAEAGSPSAEVFVRKADPLNPQTIYAAIRKGVWAYR
jgi:hypothetical protein